MKKVSLTKSFLLIIFSVIFILGLVYLGLGYYYRDSFSYGTIINGVYCTGHTPVEINKLLTERYEYSGLDIFMEEEGYEFHIAPEDIDFNYNFDQALNYYLESQNSWLWPSNVLFSKDRTLKPIVNFNTDKLDAILHTVDDFYYDEAPEVSFVENDEGVYVLKDNIMHRPDSASMREDVYDCIYESEDRLVIDEKYYYDLTYTPEQIKTLEEYTAIKTMMGARITYILGQDREIIDEPVLSSFLIRDENGKLIPAPSPEEADEASSDKGNTDAEEAYMSDAVYGDNDVYMWDINAVYSWVDELASKYDTVGKERKFKTNSGDLIKIEGGIYGNKIDRQAEKEYLLSAIESRVVEEHTPAYTQMALVQGHDDLGDTYIEVNMSDQMLYYYVKGELVIETPVVTGDMVRRMSTPSGTNYIYFKQRNRTLHGPDYATFVNYWMAVNGHIGIHDATWRSKFGGDIFKGNGSHGCINTPMEAVSKLYDLADVGTPVVMYYMD